MTIRSMFVGRGSNLRRASAYSGLLREGIRGLRYGNSLHIVVVYWGEKCVSVSDSMICSAGAYVP